MITKEYVVSEIENFYKRILRVNKKEEAQKQSDEQQNEKVVSIESKRKPIMWRGIDLSTWAEDAIERLKKRFKEVELLLAGGTIDESVRPTFRTNEEIYSTYKEVPSEWTGVTQLAKINYRTLNGEINKALDWYVLQQNEGELMKINILTTPTHAIETSIEPQTEANLRLNAPIYINNNQYDEVEEF